MINMRRILLPTDFSHFSQPAVLFACGLVDKFHAELHVLHVEEDLRDLLPDFGMGIDLQPFREAWTQSHDKREVEILARLSDVLDHEWKQGKQTTIAAKNGKPDLEITQYANEHEIDLIVMGTHGRTGLSHAMIGSVAEKIIRMAPCPVMTIRAGEHQFEMP
ncbi:MAG: universal stress protein [Planctomycetaceae bacterium]|nr:universal stress protein [Planctomycetaceae bacterium]